MYTLGYTPPGVYTPPYYPGLYTTRGIYTTLYTPGYTTARPLYLGVPVPPCTDVAVPGEEALGSNLRIVMDLRRSEASLLPKV